MSNDYIELPTHATALEFDDTSDKITYASGAAVDNIPYATWEFVVRYVYTGSYQTLWSKHAATPTYYYHIGVDGTGHVYVYRTATTGAEHWTADVALTNGNWYDIQISWAAGYSRVSGSAPIIKINDVISSVTHTGTGSEDWYTDSGKTSYIGARPDWSAYTWTGTIALYRLHDTILTDAQKHTNYLADLWRYTLDDLNIYGPKVSAIEYSVIGGTFTITFPCFTTSTETWASIFENDGSVTYPSALTESTIAYPTLLTSSTVTYPSTLTESMVLYLDNTAGTGTYDTETESSTTWCNQ